MGLGPLAMRLECVVNDLLHKAFPALQMVVSTHSPHVLSTVDKESIRVIRLQDGRGFVKTPTLQTRGMESAAVLASILEEHFSSEHPVILECDRMIRLERFKQSLPSPPNQKSD